MGNSYLFPISAPATPYTQILVHHRVLKTGNWQNSSLSGKQKVDHVSSPKESHSLLEVRLSRHGNHLTKSK